MTVFLDTSALYAVFDRDDVNHTAAGRGWNALLASDDRLTTHNYVVLELTALLQHRLGIEAVRDLVVEILPVCTVQWVSDAIHAQALRGHDWRLLDDAAKRQLRELAGVEHRDRSEGERTATRFAVRRDPSG